jgi:hypothetical protein
VVVVRAAGGLASLDNSLDHCVLVGFEENDEGDVY